jgi:hypothetical protein
MHRRRAVVKAIPLLLCIGLLLSACSAHFGSVASPNGYQGYAADPVGGGFNFGFGDYPGWSGWDHGDGGRG